jgi:hypothetical protein
MSLKEGIEKLRSQSSLSRVSVKPGMGLEGRGRRLSPLPRPALERLRGGAGHARFQLQSNIFEQIELGFLHIPCGFGVAVLASLPA